MDMDMDMGGYMVMAGEWHGYLHDFARTGMPRWSVGALASAYRVPPELQPVYGAQPRSYMVSCRCASSLRTVNPAARTRPRF